MSVTIQRISAPTAEEWRQLWSACAHATFFQGPEWARVWQRVSRGRISASPRLMTFSDGRQALMPLCFESKLGGLLSRFVASPEGTFGGWLSADALDLEHAVCLLDWLRDDLGSSLVWRLNPYDPLVFAAGVARDIECRSDHTHAIHLGAGAEAIYENLKNGYRSDIKKARKRGAISVQLASTLADWRAYYDVYQDTLARWGLRPEQGYPWALFRTLFELGSPNVKLWLAWHTGRVVSGELCFYASKHVVSWHAATLAEHLRTHAAKLQIFHVIQDACQRGYAWFDFNPSAGLAGVQTFKEGFNAERLPAPVFYVDSPLKRLARTIAAPLGVGYAKVMRRPLALLLKELGTSLHAATDSSTAPVPASSASKPPAPKRAPIGVLRGRRSQPPQGQSPAGELRGWGDAATSSSALPASSRNLR